MSIVSAPKQIGTLFRKTPVLEMRVIERALGGRSRRSLYRDLDSLGYLSSYTHAGRYYTLASLPEFDADGLWRYQGIGFSRDGTLKETVVRLVENSDAGQFHRELQRRLQVRVHNTLADVVAHHRLGRERFEGEYLYLSAETARAAAQLACRTHPAREPAGRQGELAPSLVVDVLVEIIHGRTHLGARELALRLVARGVTVTTAQVEEVFRCYDVGKKTAPSRSPHSRR
jgi:hypothetical protein